MYSFDEKSTRHLIKGAYWSFLASATPRLITFVSTVALARLLGPQEFGLFATTLLILRYLDAFHDFGVGPALIQSRENPATVVRTALTVSLASASLVSLALFWAAPQLASYFGSSDLIPIIRCLSPIFILTALANVSSFWLQKNLRFKSRVLPETAKAIGKTVISLPLAIAGFGALSLAIGHISGVAIGTVIYLYNSGLAFRLAFDIKIAKSLVSFGLTLSLLALVAGFANTLDQLIVGRILGPSSLGIYAIGMLIPDFVVLTICSVIGQAVFPAFSRVQTRKRVLKAGYLTTLRFVTSATFPAAAGLALISPQLVMVAYSEKWADSGPVMQLMAVNGLIVSIAFNAGDIWKATGNSVKLIQVAVLGTLLAFPLVLVGAQWGLIGVACARIVATTIWMIATLYLISSTLAIQLRDLMRVLWPPAASTLIMIGVCQLVLFLTAGEGPTVQLASAVSAGLLAYMASINWADPKIISVLLGGLRQAQAK